MIPPRFFLALFMAPLFVLPSCTKRNPPPSAKDDKEQNFYFGIEATLSPDDLENQMAKGQSKFLQSFADDRIPWQLWNKELLQKADQAQAPIFALIGTSLGGSSRRAAAEIEANDELRRKLASQSVCTVIDIRVHPEIGHLSFHLANEIDRSLSFPLALWLSPEGCPIAWFPLGSASGDNLEKILGNATTMIEDIWTNSSRYAILNSRRDNEARQERFSFILESEDPTISRDEVFRRSTRKVSSFYSPVDRDLDALGGLIPSSSLELLLIGSHSNLLTEEIQERCRRAVTDVSANLMQNALNDALDDGYFYARRTEGWTLPSFSKQLSAQAHLAEVMLKAGSALGDPTLFQEGLDLTAFLEKEWLAEGVAVLAPGADEDTPGTFLWDFETLEKLLNEEELRLAKLAFSLRKDGNIPAEVDPTRKFYPLNSLRNETPLPELARALELGEETVAAKLADLKAKLLAHRQEIADLRTETAITIMDLVMVTRAQIARFTITREEADLEAALATANGILTEFWNPETGLTRLKHANGAVPARGHDYAATSDALMLLYQRTLDPRWLEAAQDLFDHALKHLTQDSRLLAETREEDQVIPLRIHNTTMIFGTSTLGFSDQVAKRLLSLTGDQRYHELCQTHLQVIAPRPIETVINHTDFFISCALGSTPVVAVLRGKTDSAEGQKLLALLNEPHHLPFLVIRPEESPAHLAPLPELPEQSGEASVVLLQADKILGQATTEQEITALLDSAHSTSP